MCLLPPCLTLGAEETVFLVTAAIADKIKHIHFQKREQKSFSAYHKHPALMQSVCTTISTPCQLAYCHPANEFRSWAQLSSADESNCLSGASHDNSVPRGLIQCWYRPVHSKLSRNARPYGSGFARENRPSAFGPKRSRAYT